MSELEVHRAIVHSADPATGIARVYIPEILGAGQTVEMPTTGLINTDGFWNVPSPGSHAFVAVTEDRAHYLWLTGIAAPGSSSDPGNEPIGHEDRTQSLISFNNANRTFTIQPVEHSYILWCVGQRYEKTGPESVQIPDVTDLYYIYFDPQGRLQYRTSYFVWNEDTPTAYVYWNSATGKAEFFADERHGVTLDWQTHEYLHRTRGAAIANGFDVSFSGPYITSLYDASSPTPTNVGTFFDEDLQIDIRHSLSPAPNTWEQKLQSNAELPIYYRQGADQWLATAPSQLPVYSPVGTALYNTKSGSNWVLTSHGANKYGICWIVATNQLNYPVISIMGQAQYDNVGQADAATWDSMDLDFLPIVELRVLYKLVYLTSTTFPGYSIVGMRDYRTALSSATSNAAAVVDHGGLTGLADDDHPHYLLADGTRPVSGGLTLSGGITASGSSLFTGTVTVGSTSQYLRIRDTVNNSHYGEFRTQDLTSNRIYTFRDESGTVPLTGGLRQVLVYYSNSTFTKSSYPWLRAVRVTAVGGGGGGGGCAQPAAGASAAGGSGGGGAFVQSFISASSIPSSVAVTIGTGGSGGAAGQNNGASGGSTTFGSLVTAGGGGGGIGGASSTGFLSSSGGGGGGWSAVGTVVGYVGQPGSEGIAVSAYQASSGNGGGNSGMGVGNGGKGSFWALPDSWWGGSSGMSGTGYGGGGAGGVQKGLASTSQGPSRSGGSGTSGIVIVELYE